LKVVCDENLNLDLSIIPDQVELVRVNGREITNESLAGAEALLVRSVTSVNRKLLEGSAIRFVGTATSGTNHIDHAYLEEQGIQWSAAPGSNADAVVDYCLACIAYWSICNNKDVSELSVGVVGAGQVGSRLIQRLSAIGCEVVVCDPPLRERDESSYDFADLARISQCDIVSVHVPYTKSGKHPTEQMIGAKFFQSLSGQSLFINSCRGEVVDETALKEEIAHSNLCVAIDVWQGEPDVDRMLAENVFVASPHIAGYSVLAKKTAGSMITSDLCNYVLGVLGKEVSAASDIQIEVTESLIPDSSVWHTVLKAFDLPTLSESFKDSVTQGQVSKEFDAYRVKLAARKEFREMKVESRELSDKEIRMYRALGFQA